MNESLHILIIGCGYLGKRVAREGLARGWKVSALTRSADHAEEFRTEGIVPIVGDIMLPETLKNLPEADVVLYAVGMDRKTRYTMREVYLQGLEQILSAINTRYKKFIYISSTSVYGQEQGEWIDESSPTVPQRENGQICLSAEHLVEQVCPQKSWVILRLAGIYGPDRTLSRVEQLKLQQPIAGTAEGWLNLIHVDDAVEVVLRCMTRNIHHPVLLVSDNHPVQREGYYQYLAYLSDAPPPVFQSEETVRTRTSGLNKRCNNALVKQELDWQPQFPDFKAGLNSILQQSGN